MHQVKPQGAAFVSRALETLLRKFPAEGSRMLGDGGVLLKVNTSDQVASVLSVNSEFDKNRKCSLLTKRGRFI